MDTNAGAITLARVSIVISEVAVTRKMVVLKKIQNAKYPESIVSKSLRRIGLTSLTMLLGVGDNAAGGSIKEKLNTSK